MTVTPLHLQKNVSPMALITSVPFSWNSVKRHHHQGIEETCR